MEIKQAIELLEKATALINGNRNDHIAIQNALTAVKNFVEESEKQTADLQKEADKVAEKK